MKLRKLHSILCLFVLSISWNHSYADTTIIEISVEDSDKQVRAAIEWDGHEPKEIVVTGGSLSNAIIEKCLYFKNSKLTKDSPLSTWQSVIATQYSTKLGIQFLSTSAQWVARQKLLPNEVYESQNRLHVSAVQTWVEGKIHHVKYYTETNKFLGETLLDLRTFSIEWIPG